MTKIKICGLKRLKDVGYVNEAKPDYAGFVLHFPRSHRSLSEEEATALRARLLPEIPAVGVFVDQPMEIVVSLLKRGVIDIAQLHGSESPDYIRTLRRQT